MLLAVGDLVDADLVQVVEAVWVELVGHDAFDDGADGAPVDPTQPTDRGLVHARGRPCHEVLDVAGEPRAMAGEVDGLHDHPPAGSACQPPQRRADRDPPHAQVHRPPGRGMRLGVVPPPRRPAAVRADQPSAAQPNIKMTRSVWNATAVTLTPAKDSSMLNAVVTRTAL